ncbi:unnamed protein product [Closterium sp. NIES-53]
MAAQELRWLTYLLTDLGEQHCSPPVLYVDNKAMIALCQEHRLEHRAKHIALRYFLAQDLQQRGQLRLAYVATRANTADIFTKAFPPGHYQCFSTVLGLGPKVHFEVLGGDMGAVRHETTVLVGIPSANRWPDRADQPDDGAADQDKLPRPRSLGNFTHHAGVRVQQRTV